MNAPFDLKIFHYHFRTGGVSTVVRQAVDAFRAHLPGIRSIEVVAGDIPGEFRSAVERHTVTCRELPEIGYRGQAGVLPDNGGKPENDKEGVTREADKLAEQLLRSFGSDDSVWWIHNYHLGKNVVFTQALLRIIHSGRPQRMLLQIHDFPECGRFGNLETLQAALSLDPYPLSPWVRYAVLNRKDREILRKAGIPEGEVFLLENPVFPGRAPVPDRGTRSRLKRVFGAAFPRFEPGAPLLIYPIRTIRRKNVIEALLLCLLLEREANILITLPGSSAAERPYSDQVAALFADRLCPGLWGIGTDLQRANLHFEDLVAASDLVLSTSVQEGFGYLFVNSLLWSLPLAGRELDILSGLKELFRNYPAHFYETIRVPVADPDGLTRAYREKIGRLPSLIPSAEQEYLLAEVDTLVRDGRADFSFLPVEAQAKLLRMIAAGGGELTDCRADNRSTLSRIEELLASPVPGEGEAVRSRQSELDSRFGAAAYAAGFQRILEAFGRDTGGHRERKEGSIATGVRRAFLRLEQLRLLYDYGG